MNSRKDTQLKAAIMNAGSKIKIAIADDHPLVINGLQYLISNCENMEIAGSCANGSELLKLLAQVQPEVLLLDIHMPGVAGDELAGIISGMYPQIKMLALTNEDNVYYVKGMLRNGVLGYVLKTTRAEVLLEAINTVYRGEQYLETSLREKIIEDTFQAKKQMSAVPILSRREQEVLRYIADDLTSQQIADKIFLSKRTVDCHRLSLLTKLGVKNAASLVKRAIQLGLIK